MIHGDRPQIVESCMQKAPFWPRLKVLHLTENMRLQSGDQNTRWAKWLSEIAYNPQMYDSIQLLPEISHRFDDEELFLNEVFSPL